MASGAPGSDRLFGGPGTDGLFAGPGKNSLFGGAASDRCADRGQRRSC
jgi:hypothetical protein